MAGLEGLLSLTAVTVSEEVAKGKNAGRVFLDVVVLVEEDDDLLLGDRWCALEEEEKGVKA